MYFAKKGETMFQGWQFLLVEIWGLLLIAAFLGVFVGWIIWGGRKSAR
jgi:hypothetical protein